MVVYSDTTSKTYLEKANTCSENMQGNIAKNLFRDKKEQLYSLASGLGSKLYPLNDFCAENRR